MPCLQPEGPQHLTCPQKALDISSSTRRTWVPHLPPRRTLRLSCYKESFDVSRATGDVAPSTSNTSTSRVPAVGPQPLKCHQPDWAQAGRSGHL